MIQAVHFLPWFYHGCWLSRGPSRKGPFSQRWLAFSCHSQCYWLILWGNHCINWAFNSVTMIDLWSVVSISHQYEEGIDIIELVLSIHLSMNLEVKTCTPKKKKKNFGSSTFIYLMSRQPLSRHQICWGYTVTLYTLINLSPLNLERQAYLNFGENWTQWARFSVLFGKIMAGCE